MTDVNITDAPAPDKPAPTTQAAAEPPAPEPAPFEQRRMLAAEAPPAPSQREPDVKPERILADERARVTGIYDAARKLHVEQTLADDLVKRGITIGEARAALIDAAAARDAATETRPHIRMDGMDAALTRRAAVETALLHRFEPGRFKLTDAAREWRGLRPPPVRGGTAPLRPRGRRGAALRSGPA